ncbi:MAG: hypothetical protein LBP95_04600 [Deltaproteobacteria bacterium]|jgi:hypothetical protein|nr:hypothetical protein [Deltaproteobacteria bacterium]
MSIVLDAPSEVSERVTSRLLAAAIEIASDESTPEIDGNGVVAPLALMLSVELISHVGELEEVLELLRFLAVKVERGDYHGGRPED